VLVFNAFNALLPKINTQRPKTLSMKKLFVTIAIFSSMTLVGQPLNEITYKEVVNEKPVLKYPLLRENDIMWEKRIWRVIDVREKMNQPFARPEESLFEIMASAAKEGEIPIYSTETDDFSVPMTIDELNNILSNEDTVMVIDVQTYDELPQVVYNQVNPENVKRYRVKEIWFFDNNTSSMRTRILGIAPMIDVYDDDGNFRYEKPLFWIHYPSSREALARHRVFNSGNDGSRMTWEDLFEMRMFSSYVYKESNVGDYRLEEHFSGVDLLHQADRIERTIFNYEHDLWEQ